MKTIGFIPIRKGSKGIPNKNKRKMLGRPLFSWVLQAGIQSNLDVVYVFTDDETVIQFIEKEYHWTSKVKAVKRGEENASDTASTEAAMIEFANLQDVNFDAICLLQATSPFTTSEDINKGLQKFNENGIDTVLSVVKTHRFTWNPNGTANNYDPFNRPRRQDFDGLLIENGAFYISSKEDLIASKNRISGQVGLIEMPEDSLTEIDSETDWTIAENLLASRLKRKPAPQKITHLVLDVDGVFTDGCIYYSAEGEALKKFDMRDGMGLEIIRELAVEVMVMTSENSALVKKRMEKLNIPQVYLGVKDKFALLHHICEQQQIPKNAMAYMGDDVNDMANICAVGWGLVPNNAQIPIKAVADVLLNAASGAGAIREACQWIKMYNSRF